MKISGITLWRVPLTSHETYYMAASKTCATVETVVLCVATGGPQVGWGEVCPIPGCLPAYAAGVAPLIEAVASVLLFDHLRHAR